MTAVVLAPFEQVQHRLDEAALLSLYAVPPLRGCTRWTSERFAAAASLQRFESVASMLQSEHWGQRFDHETEQLLRKVLQDRLPLADQRLLVRQQIGEAAGLMELEGVWSDCAGGAEKHCVLDQVHFRFGESWAEGEAIGRAYAATDNCDVVEMLVAAGKITRSGGKLDGLSGTFVLNGRLDEYGYRGAVALRLADSQGRVRTQREIETPLGFHEQAAATFLELRVASEGAGRDDIVAYDNGRMRLQADYAARSARYVSECRGHRGLQSQVLLDRIVGRAECLIEADAAVRPLAGLTARYRYRAAIDEVGKNECAGTLDLIVDESVVIETETRAEATRFVQFAGIGRIVGGTGVFEGASGVFAENSALALAPPALSLFHLSQIADAAGRYRPVR
jgi:hypothetical protein